MMMSTMMNNDEMMNTNGNNSAEHRKQMQNAMNEVMKTKNQQNMMKNEKIKAK